MPPPPNTPAVDWDSANAISEMLYGPRDSTSSIEAVSSLEDRVYAASRELSERLEERPQSAPSSRPSSPSVQLTPDTWRREVDEALIHSGLTSDTWSAIAEHEAAEPWVASVIDTMPTPTQSNTCQPDLAPTSEIRPLDYQDLHYVDDVDETLQCPICHTPFYEPITTRDCGHTFCTACLRRALGIQPVCPIDRQPMTFHPTVLCNPRIVGHQLDRLRVRCPNFGCDVITSRGSIKTHYERDCKKTLVRCADRGCDKFTARDELGGSVGCLHMLVDCRYCKKEILYAERERHYDTACESSTGTCLECNSAIVRHRMQDHIKDECPEAHASCRFNSYGCSFNGIRKTVVAHEDQGCVYEAIAKLIKDRAEDRAVITHLRGRLTALEGARQPPAHVRSRSPRTNRHNAPPPLLPASDFGLAISAGSDSNGGSASLERASPNGDESAWESPEDYMLAQFERIETKLEDLRKTLTELDGRHSMMLLNETMSLKDQITELRSNLGVISMHTTWLMNVQRQNRVAAGGGGGGASTQGSQQQQQQRAGGNAGSNTDSPVTATGTGGQATFLDRLVATARAGPRRMSAENPPRL